MVEKILCQTEIKVEAKLQNSRMKQAIDILSKVSEDWSNTQVENYPSELPSFDEVVSSLSVIEFKEVV